MVPQTCGRPKKSRTGLTKASGGETKDTVDELLVRRCADRALAFIVRGFREGDALLTRSSRLSGMERFRLVSSVYLPSFILHSWGCAVEGDPVTRALSRFLVGQVEEGGVWRFFGKGSPVPPLDFDDTCCVLASLKESHIDIDTRVWELLSKQRSKEGTFYTWADDRSNSMSGYSVDMAVNANILFLAALCGKRMPRVVSFINDASSRIPGGLLSPFSVSEFGTIYLVSRAYADGGASGLEPAMSNITDYLLGCQRVDGRWGNSITDTALSIVALLNAGSPGRATLRSLDLLSHSQRPSGSFGCHPFFKDFTGTYYGSPYLTAALFLEAASKLARLRANVK